MQIETNSVWAVNSPIKDRVFFKSWLELLKPYHRLTSKAIELASVLLEQRYMFEQRGVSDEGLLNKLVFSTENKRKIREDLNLKKEHFQYLLTLLRNAKIVINNTLNPRYIPNIKKDDKKFCISFIFKLDDDNK